MKIKKTDLPVMPPESDILPSLDDADSEDEEEEEEDEIDDDDEDMMADEAADDEEYDSEEDGADLCMGVGSDRDSDADSVGDNWNNILSTTASMASKPVMTIKEVTTTQVTPSTTERTTELPKSSATALPTPDPNFTHFDHRSEHQSYKEAQQRLEESHRENYQLAAMHQQRVLAHINQRKREAMTCYTQALTKQPPNAHLVEKCLQKILRALHKDRAHARSLPSSARFRRCWRT
jgi:amyloid beta A4 protein